MLFLSQGGCDRESLGWSHDSYLLMVTLLYNPLLQSICRTWLASKWQRQRGVYDDVYIITLHKTVTPTLLRHFFIPCWLWRCMLPCFKLLNGEGPVTRDWGLPLADNQQESWDHPLTACKELDSANNHVSIEVDLFPIWVSDETTALANTLMAALWDLEAEDPNKLCLNSWPIETVRK